MIATPVAYLSLCRQKRTQIGFCGGLTFFLPLKNRALVKHQTSNSTTDEDSLPAARIGGHHHHGIIMVAVASRAILSMIPP